MSKQHVKEKLRLALAHDNTGPEYWNGVLWSDESKLELFWSKDRKTISRKHIDGQKINFLWPAVKRGISFMMARVVSLPKTFEKWSKTNGITTEGVYWG
jgi:hypothetical protein